MIDGRGLRVDRHSLDGCPVHAVGRRRIDDVVRIAVETETAVFPRDVDPAGGVHRGRRYRACTNASGIAGPEDRCNVHRARPGLAAIRRRERDDAIAALDRHDDGSVRLDQWLASKTGIEIRCISGRRPGCAAVPRPAHHDEVAAERLIPLGVTVAIVRTRRRIVAGDPSLVGRLRARRDADRLHPVDAVRGSADQHCRRMR